MVFYLFLGNEDWETDSFLWKNDIPFQHPINLLQAILLFREVVWLGFPAGNNLCFFLAKSVH